MEVGVSLEVSRRARGAMLKCAISTAEKGAETPNSGLMDDGKARPHKGCWPRSVGRGLERGGLLRAGSRGLMDRQPVADVDP